MRLFLALCALIALLLAASFVVYLAAGKSGRFNLTFDELRDLYRTENSRFTDISGVSLHYEVEGSGPPLVLLHGSHGSLRGWDPVTEKLAQDFRVIRPDLPGRGLSSAGPPEIPESVTLHSIVIDLVDRLGIEGPIHVAGESSGGTIASRVAAHYPDRVDKVVLINMPSTPVRVPLSARPPVVRLHFWIVSEILGFTYPAYWTAYYRYLWGDADRLNQDLLRWRHDEDRTDRDRSARALIPANYSPGQADRNLAGVQTETLVIWGLKDALLPPDQLEALLSKLKNAEITVETRADVGHFPTLESPLWVADEMAAFLVEPTLP